jgi:simple sugar transport system ATP-binding protein
MDYAVEMRGITKRFGAALANDVIDLQLRRGEVHTLLGENGAGKTTLARILYGLYRPDAGEILIDGRLALIASPRDAIQLGIGMVTQHFALVPTLTVAENIVLGATRSLQINPAAIESAVADAAIRLGIEIDASTRVSDLAVGQKQRVEILKALYRKARVLILDEPTAALVPQEVEALFRALTRLRENGLSVILISHKLKEVMAISDRVTVLRNGQLVGTVNTAETTPARLAQMMVGREIENAIRLSDPLGFACPGGQARENPKGLPVLTIQNLCASNVKHITLTINAGEILGLVGVSGSGQKELAEALCGVRRSTGRVWIGQHEVTGASPAELVAAGLGRIPEDRHAGVVGDLTVAENLALEHLDEFSPGGVLARAAILRHAETLIRQFQIKARPTDLARTLSGGNLQKLLLARTLSRQPKVVIAPQPTRGLDIGATEYVHRQLLALRANGAGVLLISEDLDEILALADRIAVIYAGEIVGILSASEANAERLGLMMSGAARYSETIEPTKPPKMLRLGLAAS